ncbi:trehalose-phosphatase [Luteimonas wenzhouensis]|uniref:Trehalose 6-phosphate phosphatase n=1 Tax=Luteimonas wenzhouensis TaxID=2599615 RepID=A0A5C5U6X6_9GAMM|nr:trehalose-phosphatase [Luteimonas wenzhouensis]TWT21754.1 trehalose-phosphatase [Luteimonas wenzhouensis]
MTHDGTPPLPPPPPLSDQWALFLDVDGTLAAFADQPDGVSVASPVVDRLDELSRMLDGALALVSGRRIETLDALFAPHRFAAAGLHGLQRRRAGEEPPPPAAPPAALEAIKAQAAALLRERYPDALLEDKGEAIALHWRLMPEAAADLQAFAMQALTRLPDYHLQPGDHVVELRPARGDKGEAIAAFLDELPFLGRRPVFVGDDLTDEHGFEVVNARGGISVLVGDRAGSAAEHRLPGIDAVYAWLGAGA